MADKKMTQKRALEIVIDILKDDENEDVSAAVEILQEMLNKKNAPRKRKVDELTEAFRAKLIDVLMNAENPMTNKEIQEELQKLVDAGELKLPEKDGEPVMKVSPQKVANNLRVFEKDGSVIRTRGEKASDKDTFSIATA